MVSLDSRWPCQELCTFLQDLTKQTCTESHLSSIICTHNYLNGITVEYLALSPKLKMERFPVYAYNLFMLFHYNSYTCSFSRGLYQTRLREYAKLYPTASNIIPELLSMSWDTQTEKEPDQFKRDQLISLVNSFSDVSGTIPAGADQVVRYTMDYNDKIILNVRCTLEQSKAAGQAAKIRTIEARLLHYHILLDRLHQRGPLEPAGAVSTTRLGSMIFFGQLGAGIGVFPALLSGLLGISIYQAIKHRVGINRSKPENLQYAPLSPFVSFALDSWSSGWGGRICFSKSNTWGYVKIAIPSEPNVLQYVPFDFRTTLEPVEPNEIWNLREWLLWAYRANKLELRHIFFIFETLLKPLPGCSDQIRGLLSGTTKIFIESLFPLCLDEELKKGKANKCLVESCESSENKSATLSFSDVSSRL